MSDVVRTIIEQQEVHVVTLGQQGPPGAQGAAGSGTGTESYIAGEALGGHRVVKANASGQAVYADKDDLLSQFVLGVTLGAVLNGAVVEVRRAGTIVEPSWSWTANAPIFLGASGVLTQTYPAGAVVAVQVGFATAATAMVVAPREPISLS